MTNYQEVRADALEEVVRRLDNVRETARKKRKAPDKLILDNILYQGVAKIEAAVQAERDEELQEIALMLQRREMETSSGVARNAYLDAAHLVMAVDTPFVGVKLSRFNWPSLAVLAATFVVLGVVAWNVWKGNHA